MPTAITAIAELIIFSLLEFAYIRLARTLGWISNGAPEYPGVKRPAVGGGLIFFIGIMCVLPALPFSAATVAAAAGFALLACVSFIDDLHPLSIPLRLGAQAVAVIIPMALASLQFPELTWMQLPGAVLSVLFIIGFMNAYNFMDGMNGITSGYALAVLCTMPVLGIPFTMLLPVIMATLAFSIFNFRRHAAVFSGDAGSIVMGAFIAALLVTTDSFPASILAVGVYLTDAGMTLLARLRRGENIFRAHKEHIYQMLVYRLGLPELAVASAYALLQVGLTLPLYFLLGNSVGTILYVVAAFAALVALWTIIRRHLINRPHLSDIYLKH